MANQSSTDLKSLTIKTIAAGLKTLSRPAVIAVALFLLVGAAHAQRIRGTCGSSCDPSCSVNNNCLLVSDYANSQVLQYDTAGCPCTPHTGTGNWFLTGYSGGGGGGEGLACIAGIGGQGELINSSNGPDLAVFNLTTGAYTGTQLVVSGADFTALSANTLGTQLYAADYTGNLDLINLNPLSLMTSVPSAYKHDVAVGYSGYIFATDFFTPSPPGVEEYNPDLSGGTNYIPYNPTCWTFTNGDGKSHCTSHLSGMAWDGTGNLWVSSDAGSPDENGIFEFAVSPTGQLLNGGVPLNFTPDTAALGFCSTDPCRPIGVAVAPPGALDYAGNIIVANFSGDDVLRIAPSCTGTLANGGLGECTAAVFFRPAVAPGGNTPDPKYPIYTQSCPNPENDGYVEICKAANTQFPPPNQLYDFTVSGPFFNSGPTPIQVPLGECSGPIQVPSATLANPDTITESPVIGVLVSDVTAIAYNSLGMQINQLANWTLPDLNAGVGVQAGDVSLETIATFTNYTVGRLGQLKICKIAGQPGVLNQVFDFTAVDSQGQQMYMIEAGPPDQGGYCVLGDTLAINTQAGISETPNPSYPLSNIAVQCDGCTYTINLAQYSVSTTIGAGVTEVDFTDIQAAETPFYTNLGTGETYQCGPIGWNVAGSGSTLPSSYTQAAEFTSQASGSVSQIDVAVSPVSGVDSFFVALYASSGNLPGTEIAEWSNQVAIGCPGIVSITGITGVSLTAGNSYFLVVGPTNNSSTTYERWNLNNQGATGAHLYATSGCQNGSGNNCSWNSLGTTVLAAFDIK